MQRTIPLLFAMLVAAGVWAETAMPAIEKFAYEDFSWVSRSVAKAPAFKSEKPRWTIWVLGEGKQSVMLQAWDESGGTGSGYDTFYFDRNFNGDLTEDGERFAYGGAKELTVGGIQEAGGTRTFSFKLVPGGDNFSWQSRFGMNDPQHKIGYAVQTLPGNVPIAWSEDLKTAPVYRFGGPAIPIPIVADPDAKKKRSRKPVFPGDELGAWEAGRQVGVGMIVALLGDRYESRLQFYHSKFPGGQPLAMLRFRTAAGMEDLPFVGGCG